MARTPMVTRTITTTEANVLCLDIQKGEPFNTLRTVPRTYKSDDELLKAVKPLIECNENVKAVHIVDKTEIETLYGMLEQEFIEHATILPPRTGVTEKENETE